MTESSSLSCRQLKHITNNLPSVLFLSQASCVGLYGRCLSLMVCVLLSLACALGFLLYYSKESGSLRFPFARLLTLLFLSLPPLRLLPQDFQREFAACFSTMKQILKTCTQSRYACVVRKTTEARLRSTQPL